MTHDPNADRQRYYVHGIGYVDERLMMYSDDHERPYYYVIDRMYNVRAMVDRAGAVVERVAYDGYGRPYLRESAGRGDFTHDGSISSGDQTRFDLARAASIWDPRADMDDDGDVDATDESLFDAKRPTWDPSSIDFGSGPTVSQAFSDVDNPYFFQGVPHFALDTAANATEGKLMLNHHRARFADPVAGRWGSRDPLFYTHMVRSGGMRLDRGKQHSCLYDYAHSSPTKWRDPTGLEPCYFGTPGAGGACYELPHDDCLALGGFAGNAGGCCPPEPPPPPPPPPPSPSDPCSCSRNQNERCICYKDLCYQSVERRRYSCYLGVDVLCVYLCGGSPLFPPNPICWNLCAATLQLGCASE